MKQKPVIEKETHTKRVMLAGGISIYRIDEDGYIVDYMGFPVELEVLEEMMAELLHAIMNYDDEQVQAHREKVLLNKYPEFYTEQTGKPVPQEYIIVHNERRRKDREEERLKRQSGYIYVLQSEHGYKIGRTKNINQRKHAFGVKLPFPVEMVIVAQTDRMLDLEKQLHRMFANKRIDGEWFKLDDADLNFIKNYCENYRSIQPQHISCQ